MNVNLIDRDVFLAKPPIFKGPRAQDPFKSLGKSQGLTPEELHALRNQHFNEADRFILSDSNTLEQ